MPWAKRPLTAKEFSTQWMPPRRRRHFAEALAENDLSEVAKRYTTAGGRRSVVAAGAKVRFASICVIPRFDAGAAARRRGAYLPWGRS